MRVIAGTAGGIRLAVPETDVRPTMDRVKAAIFSSLATRSSARACSISLPGPARLGIEALSRGAASAVFVEENRAAVAAIEQNLARTKLRGRVRKQEVFAFLEFRSSPRAVPTYLCRSALRENESPAANSPGSCSRIKSSPKCSSRGGIFVLEKRPEEQIPASRCGTSSRARLMARRRCSSCCPSTKLRAESIARAAARMQTNDADLSTIFSFRSGSCFSCRATCSKMRRRGNYRRNFGQRFGSMSRACGVGSRETAAPGFTRSASGEVAIALKLARKAARNSIASFDGVLTTTTTTGFAFADAGSAGDGCEVMYNPLDFWPIMRRAFASFGRSGSSWWKRKSGRTSPPKRGRAGFRSRW